MAWDDKFNTWYNGVIPDTTNLLSWIEPRRVHWEAWRAHRYWVIPASIVPSLLIGARLRMRYAEDPDRTFGVFLVIFLIAVPCVSFLFYLYGSLIAWIPRGVVICPDHLIVGAGRGAARYYYRAIDLAQMVEVDGQPALDVHFKTGECDHLFFPPALRTSVIETLRKVGVRQRQNLSSIDDN